MSFPNERPNIEMLEARRDVEGLIKALGHKDAKSLLTVVMNTDYEVRKSAAKALGEIGDARAVEPLISALLRDSNEIVRGAAATALGEIGDARAVKPLTTASETDSDLFVQSLAVRALKELEQNANKKKKGAGFLSWLKRR